MVYSPREQAWIELSDLFRDTELTAQDYENMARQLQALGFTAAAAEQILREDVTPVFGWNLVTTAGNWTGWKDEDVLQRVRHWLDLRKQPSLLAKIRVSGPACWLRARLLLPPVMSLWKQVAARMEG